MSAILTWARRVFAGWILAVSAVAAWHFAGLPVSHGAPGWLMFSIAAVEAIAAAGFFWRPAALAMAGLLASFAAAAVIHIQLGQTPVMLLVYALATVLLYLAAQRQQQR